MVLQKKMTAIREKKVRATVAKPSAGVIPGTVKRMHNPAPIPPSEAVKKKSLIKK